MLRIKLSKTKGNAWARGPTKFPFWKIWVRRIEDSEARVWSHRCGSNWPARSSGYRESTIYSIFNVQRWFKDFHGNATRMHLSQPQAQLTLTKLACLPIHSSPSKFTMFLCFWMFFRVSEVKKPLESKMFKYAIVFQVIDKRLITWEWHKVSSWCFCLTSCSSPTWKATLSFCFSDSESYFVSLLFNKSVQHPASDDDSSFG